VVEGEGAGLISSSSVCWRLLFMAKE
jgi:hypothetical protein